MSEEQRLGSDEFPRKPSTRSGGCHAYSVEARLSEYAEPQELCGQLLTNKWKKVQFAKSNCGVPDGPLWENERRQYDLLGYAAARPCAGGFTPTRKRPRGSDSACLSKRAL